MYCPRRLDQVGTASEYCPGPDPVTATTILQHSTTRPIDCLSPLASPSNPRQTFAHLPHRDGHIYCQRRRQITPSRVRAFEKHRPPLEDPRSVDPLPVAHRLPSLRAATPRRTSQHMVEIMRSLKGEDRYAVVPKQAVAQVHRNAETRRGPRARRSPKESLRPLISLPTSGSRCEKVKSPKSPKEMAGYEIRNYRGEG